MTSPCEKVIRRDITRTYPEHEFFKERDGLGQESLFNVIKVRKYKRFMFDINKKIICRFSGLFFIRSWSWLLPRHWFYCWPSTYACQFYNWIKFNIKFFFLYIKDARGRSFRSTGVYNARLHNAWNVQTRYVLFRSLHVSTWMYGSSMLFVIFSYRLINDYFDRNFYQIFIDIFKLRIFIHQFMHLGGF
jgi:hypothetical protein